MRIASANVCWGNQSVCYPVEALFGGVRMTVIAGGCRAMECLEWCKSPQHCEAAAAASASAPPKIHDTLPIEEIAAAVPGGHSSIGQAEGRGTSATSGGIPSGAGGVHAVTSVDDLETPFSKPMP